MHLTINFKMILRLEQYRVDESIISKVIDYYSSVTWKTKYYIRMKLTSQCHSSIVHYQTLYFIPHLRTIFFMCYLHFYWFSSDLQVLKSPKYSKSHKKYFSECSGSKWISGDFHSLNDFHKIPNALISLDISFSLTLLSYFLSPFCRNNKSDPVSSRIHQRVNIHFRMSPSACIPWLEKCHLLQYNSLASKHS